MKKLYSLYVHHLNHKTNNPEKIQSSNNIWELISEWEEKNKDSIQFHILNPDSITTRMEYGIASNLDGRSITP